jgi:hypothetical protein
MASFSTFYDLVIEVAIVRPGPIQGDMVHPYIRRREGKEPVHFPTPALEKVLGKTLGVPLFQEQAMQVAMVAAGFSPTEADQLRRAMATFKSTGGVNAFQDKLITGMLDNGYTREFAERTFRQLEGFGSYGFPESHAASFALIAYARSAAAGVWPADVVELPGRWLRRARGCYRPHPNIPNCPPPACAPPTCLPPGCLTAAGGAAPNWPPNWPKYHCCAACTGSRGARA